ncbi:hypothetical protein Tco_1201161 [Tanacetum coccineum]
MHPVFANFPLQLCQISKITSNKQWLKQTLCPDPIIVSAISLANKILNFACWSSISEEDEEEEENDQNDDVPINCKRRRARCVATLLHEMRHRGKDSRFGVVSMCIGNPEGLGAELLEKLV